MIVLKLFSKLVRIVCSRKGVRKRDESSEFGRRVVGGAVVLLQLVPFGAAMSQYLLVGSIGSAVTFCEMNRFVRE